MPAPAPLTPIEAFLAPLARLAAKHPALEGWVYWEAEGWPDEPAETLESEEIAFYAEGLLLEGFRMVWQAVGEEGTNTRPDHLRLFFWQEAAAPVPEPAAPWRLLSAASWTGEG